MSASGRLALAISGACGRMGLAVGRLALADPGAFRIAAPLEMRGHARLGEDYGAVLGSKALGVAVADRLEAAADVLIDFSSAEGAAARAAECARRDVALVVGTTGLDGKGRAAIERAGRTVPVVLASNMSVGMNLVFVLVEEAARRLGPDADVEIVETHHRHKKDAPSGSALTLAEAAARGRGAPARELKRLVALGRAGVGARPAGQIGIHAVRGGDVVGEHVVSFIAEGETIEIAHRARSRDVFARGALLAARRLRGRKPGVYSMRDLL